jgi:hypothetical protein
VLIGKQAWFSYLQAKPHSGKAQAREACPHSKFLSKGYSWVNLPHTESDLLIFPAKLGPTKERVNMSSLSVLKAALEKLEARDLEGFLAMLTEDCVIMKDNGEVVAHGSAALRSFYTPIFTGQETLTITITDEFETGSIVAVRESNKDMSVNGELKDVDTVWIYRISSGKIAYMHVFSPDAEASEALDSVTL